MSARRLAERLSRGIVFCRRLPPEFGRLPLYVTPEAGLRFWGFMSRVDPVLYRMVGETVEPSSVVCDVGSNVGLFSACAAALSGRSVSVLAIEPYFWLAHLIHRSSQRLKSENCNCAEIEVLCASISNSNRISKLAVAEQARASNYMIETIGVIEGNTARCFETTVSLSLDFLLQYFPPPDVLKIDVETHEVFVLKGAERILREVRPKIWCEVTARNSDQVTRLLQGANYKLYGAQVNPHPLTERAWFHTLAIPN